MRFRTVSSYLLALVFTFSLVATSFSNAAAEEKKSEFARATIDFGTVVSDIEKSVKFYTEAIGFTEAEGFAVPGKFCADSGLTAGAPLKVRVLVLGEGESATRFKLMQLPGIKSKKSDNTNIHAQLGYSYTTIFVNDTTAALARLKKAGVAPIAKGPVPLPKGLPAGVFLTVVRDPDGNLIELVGPKK